MPSGLKPTIARPETGNSWAMFVVGLASFMAFAMGGFVRERSKSPDTVYGEIIKPEYTEEDAFKTAIVERLDLANTRDNLEDLERQIILVRDALGIQMNLIGSANARSPSDEQNP